MKTITKPEKKIQVQCVICGKFYLIPQSEWERYKEEWNPEAGRAQNAYICNADQDFDPDE